VCERLARQSAIDFRIAPGARWNFLGKAACQMRLIFPVNRGDIDSSRSRI
jgi:hypothetical protein